MLSPQKSISAGALVAVFLVALSVRLVFCFYLVPKYELANGPHSEDFWKYSDGYVDLAKNLVGQGKMSFAPDAPASTFRAPVFPMALALVFRAVSGIDKAVLLLNSVASSLAAVVALLIAAHFVPHLSRLAKYSAALLPFSIWYCASAYSDAFYSLTVLVFLLAMVKLVAQPQIATMCGAGVAFAISCLTKAVLLPFPVLLFAWALLRKRKSLIHATLAMLLGFMIISVWTVRNYRVSQEFITISQGIGFNLLAGNYMLEEWSDSQSSFKHATKRTLADLAEATGRERSQADIRPDGHFDLPTDLDRVCGQLAKKQFAENRVLILKKLFWNSIRFWYFTTSPHRCALAAVMNFPMIALGLIGMLAYRGKDPRAFELLMLFGLFFVGTYALIIVSGPRFCLPLIMVLAPFAGQVISDAYSAPFPDSPTDRR